jgi:hypothetical protein
VPVWSPIPINVSNFLMVPLPIWEFSSHDHSSVVATGSPTRLDRKNKASLSYARKVPRREAESRPEFRELMQRYKKRYPWLPV